MLHGLIQALNALPATQVRGVTHSPVTGNQGTLEFFLHVFLGKAGPAPNLAEAVSHAVARALALDSYKKA